MTPWLAQFSDVAFSQTTATAAAFALVALVIEKRFKKSLPESLPTSEVNLNLSAGRYGLIIYLLVLAAACAVAIIYWGAVEGFGSSRFTLGAFLAFGALYSVSAPIIFGLKRGLRIAAASWLLILTATMLAGAGTIMVQVIALGFGLAPPLFFLFLGCALIIDGSLNRIINSTISKMKYYPGSLAAPAAVILLAATLYGPQRQWLASPLQVFGGAPSTILMVLGFFLAPSLLIYLGRRFTGLAPTIWVLLKAVLIVEILLSAASAGSAMVYRIDEGRCAEVFETGRAIRPPMTALASDVQLFDGYLVVAMKEARFLRRFDSQGNESRLRLPYPPEKFYIDPQSKLIYIIHVDVTDAPMSVVRLDPFEAVGKITLPDCKKTFWLLEDRTAGLFAVFCNSQTNNVITVDGRDAKIVDSINIEPFKKKYFYGAFDFDSGLMWAFNLVDGEGVEYPWPTSGATGEKPLRRIEPRKSLVQDAIIFDGKLVVSRNMQAAWPPMGQLDVYSTTSLELINRVPVYSPRYLAHDPGLGILYLLSLADGALHYIDDKSFELLRSEYIGEQPRSIRIGDDHSLNIASKCGAMIYLPELPGDRYSDFSTATTGMMEAISSIPRHGKF